MLKNEPWMKSLTALDIEKQQANEEGRDISDLRDRFADLDGKAVSDSRAVAAADALLEEIQTLPLRSNYPHDEPADLPDIRQARPAGPKLSSWEGSSEDLYDRVYGAWLGRCGGCLLGQPIEGWRQDRIQGLLRATGNWPVSRYISSDIAREIRDRFEVSDEHGAYGAARKGWINNVSGMPEDDDTNYTVLALRLVERCGRDFNSDDIAEQWLMSLPLLHTCTAERVAYINLANLRLPPESAAVGNPYREWIGAQIRADLFGYINPGRPEAAAEMAWRDGRISHVRNGIYGEMFIAAMIAAAFVTTDPRTIVEAGMAEIPEGSRLAGELRALLSWQDSGLVLEEVHAKIRSRWDETNPHHWCHVISNALLVVCGLLYGGMDYTKSVGLGIIAGFDTDCNAATIGSIVGTALGAGRLPAVWTDPLNDSLLSGVDGEGRVRISDLARRTVNLIS